MHASDNTASSRSRGLLMAFVLLLTPFSHVRVEQDSDLLGHNLKRFPLRSPDYRLCQQACEQDRRCKAATYVKPGIQGPQAVCYLKGQMQSAELQGAVQDCARESGLHGGDRIPRMTLSWKADHAITMA